MVRQLQSFSNVVTQCILVLLCKVCDVVDDISSIVLDHELRRLELACLLVMRVLVFSLQVELMHLSEQVFVITSNGTFLVDKFKQRWLCNVLRLKQLQAARAIFKVDVGDGLGAQLVLVFVHLEGNHVRVEVLLKLLIGVVDAQLLKTVLLEAFKAEDIEQSKRVDRIWVATRRCVHLGRDRIVDLAHDPVEEFAVDGLGARVPG